VRVGGDDGELRPWHYIHVDSIESILIIPSLPTGEPDAWSGWFVACFDLIRSVN